MATTVTNARNYRFRNKILACILSTTFALVAAELAVRFFAAPAEEMVFLSKDGSIEWDCYCSNPRGYFKPRTLRDGRTVYCVDHSDDPPREVELNDTRFADCYKVLAIGDSFTWGLGVKLADSWPLELGKALESRTAACRDGKKVAVSNRGQIGFDVAAVRETFLQATAKCAPDACIYGFCLNDPLDATVHRTQFVRTRDKAADMDNANVYDGINLRTENLKRLKAELPFADLRTKSRLLDLALSRIEWRRIRQSVVQSHLDLYDHAKNADGLRITFGFISEMNLRQKAVGKRFCVAIFPLFVDVARDYPFREVHEKLAAELHKRDVEVIDLLPIFQSAVGELTVHPIDQHPNEVAHRLAAKAIADFLCRDRLK